jgi:hypothetical protein
MNEDTRDVFRGLLTEARVTPDEASVKRILRADLKSFLANPVPGFVWEPKAWYMARRPNRTQIQLGPSFFKLPKGNRRKSILRHEFGHDLIVDYNRDFLDVMEPFKSGGSGASTRYDNPYGAESRPEEMIADTYAALFSGGESWYDGDKYKNLIAVVKRVARKVGLPLP